MKLTCEIGARSRFSWVVTKYPPRREVTGFSRRQLIKALGVRGETDMDEPKTVKLGDSEIELRVEESLLPSVLRAFAGSTNHDAQVDAMQIPASPIWLNVCTRMLRWYRMKRSAAIERRCVFDPSCSRYSELAYRKLGFVGGTLATLKRLRRCRPGSGGVDLP